VSQEKRKTPRIKKGLTVLYTYHSRTKGHALNWNMTSVQDLSEGGMRIILNENFSPDEILFFRIKFPSRPFEWQEMSGKVLESSQLKNPNDEIVAGQYLARIGFLELTPEKKWLLEDYIYWFLEQSGGE
jgi:hypothetical protein